MGALVRVQAAQVPAVRRAQDLRPQLQESYLRQASIHVQVEGGYYENSTDFI